VTHLERNQVTELRIDFDARLDLAETTVSVPLDPLTYTETIETDIFGTKPTDPGGDSTAGNDTDDGSTTQTETPSEDTETRTETTPTDDDGILGDGTETTSAPTPTETATPAETTTATTETETTTDDDGGLLG
jgi:hypothetical protein